MTDTPALWPGEQTHITVTPAVPDAVRWARAQVFVPGTPRPQGSHRAFVVKGFARVVEDNKKTNPWRADIHAATRAVTGPVIVYPTEPVALVLVFVMPRRAAEPKRVTPAHVRKPDVDKLARAVLDALAGLIYTQDQQVTDLHAHKRTALPGETPGLHVHWRLDHA